MTNDLAKRVEISREEQRRSTRFQWACMVAVLAIIFVVVPLCESW